MSITNSFPHAPLCLLLAILAAGTTTAQDTIDQPTPEERQQAQHWTAQLDAPDFATRAQASESLITIGLPCYTVLRDAYLHQPSLEKKIRIENIIHRMYLNYHLYDKTGFLGVAINMQFFPTNLDHPLIPQDRRALHVMNIVPGSGAEQSGLPVDSFILKLDGRFLDEFDNPDISEALINHIRHMKAGTTVELTILTPPPSKGTAADRTLATIPVKLTRRPVEQYRDASGSQWLQEVEQSFLLWWQQNFEPDKTDTDKADPISNGESRP